MTSIAATHTGTCQLCGKRHMLPGGKLAKHGYTVDYGYFNGTCRGSDELPFEQSKDVAERALAGAISHRDHLLATAEAVPLAGYEDGTVMARFERPIPGNRFKTKSSWEKGRIDTHLVIAESDGFQQRHNVYALGDKVVSTLQKAYADTFRREARQLDQYIEWQSERCAKWAPAELQPVENEEAKKTHVIRYRDGSGYVTDVYGGSWSATAYKGELEKAKRYTERGAKQMVGKLRMWKKLEVVAL